MKISRIILWVLALGCTVTALVFWIISLREQVAYDGIVDLCRFVNTDTFVFTMAFTLSSRVFWGVLKGTENSDRKC